MEKNSNIAINKNGIRILMCCASCSHHSDEATGTQGLFRACHLEENSGITRRNTSVCKLYDMDNRYVNLHYSETLGRIKKGSYFKMVTAIREAEKENKVPQDKAMSCEDIRKRYLLENDESVYMEI